MLTFDISHFACFAFERAGKYRTRTESFEMDDSRRDPTRPEKMLCSALNDWRINLLAGAGLKNTNLKRDYPPHVYQHCQNKESGSSRRKGALRDGGLPSGAVDDFHSPVRAEASADSDEADSDYIKLRIESMIAFYKRRIPIYTQHSLNLKLAVLMLGVAASVLARYELLTWVIVATAAATATTSWTEFGDAAHKVERYSSAIDGLTRLLSSWHSLGPVHKTSRASIANLVLTAEAIINEEQVSWGSTASKQEVEKDHNEETKTPASA